MPPAKRPKRAKPTVDNRVFCCNIPHYVTDAMLRDRFNLHGDVKDMFYIKDFLGSDRGWACITYGKMEDGATAVAMENGQQFEGMERDGRTLHVKFCNHPFKTKEGTVFEPRPCNQRVVTAWRTEQAEPEEDGTGGGVGMVF